jgi:hypothetical protein
VDTILNNSNSSEQRQRFFLVGNLDTISNNQPMPPQQSIFSYSVALALNE